MLVGGKEARVVGRISMDYTTLDLSGVPEAVAGDAVTIIEDDARSAASIYAVARAAGTIPSEVICGIGARIPRVATGQEVAVEVLTRRAGKVRGRPVRVAAQ
jgi:alanine racemase